MNLNLNPLALPAGTRFPGTMAAMLTLIQQYMEIEGQDSFDGLVFSEATPAAEDRDKPWFKIDSDGKPIGLLSWNGAAWEMIPTTPQSGATAGRPTSPQDGQQYLDTDINVLIHWVAGEWRTVGGASGDVKFSNQTTLAEAIRYNPGWEEFTGARGRVIGGAGISTEPGITARTWLEIVGEETHTLTEAELPAHAHDLQLARGTATGSGFGADSGLYGKLTSAGVGGTDTLAPSTGGDTPHENMQPTIFAWCLQKR